MVELAVAIFVMAILAVMAAPSFVEMMASQRVQTAASALFTSLLRARSEAIKQNTDVTVSPSGAWKTGWSVAVGGTPIDTYTAPSSVSVSGPAGSVTYRNSGRISGAAPAFTISAAKTSAKRCVQVRLSGEPIVTSSACS